MKTKTVILLALSLSLACSHAQAPSWQELVEKGEFRRAKAVLDSLLEKSASTLGKKQIRQLLWQLEWMKRVRQDYPYGKADLLKQLKARIRDFRPEEFRQWLRQGRFDYRVIDGDTLFLYASVSNLFWRYPDIRARRTGGQTSAKFDRLLYRTAHEIRRRAEAGGQTLVMPKRFRATFTLTVRKNAVPPGETLRCWIPIPREYPRQRRIELISAEPKPIWIDRADSPIRSVYLESVAQAGRETVFRVTVRYQTFGRYQKLNPALAARAPARDRSVQPFLQDEPPHVVFAPELVRLADSLTAGETNPLRKARRAYDWIVRNIRYSYAPEYSTIANLSRFTYRHRYGDCGQEAMLFITLCRILGVPARWQSGWFIMPGGKTIHDWAEIFVEPYGWIPVEPYLGIYTSRYAAGLFDSQKQELVDFYFGNLDPYRYIANSDHGQVLFPLKRHFRSDNVDFQRGEVEWRGGNLYFDQFTYRLDVEEEKE